MDVVIRPSAGLSGELMIPADKAICHRAALVSALAEGATTIGPWADAEDVERTLDVLRGLGIAVRRRGRFVRIEGRGLVAPRAALGCGESGTTMRLSCGLLSGQPFNSRLSARGSLRNRPMRRIIEPLSRMCAAITGQRALAEICPPLVVRGRRPLRSIAYAMPVASAQVKSAILLAGLFADGPTAVTEPIPTRDHTERMLRAAGVSVRRRGRAVIVTPPRRRLRLPPRLVIPGDFSSAAFFIVAASLVPGSQLLLRDVGFNPTRTHLLAVLRRMGAVIRVVERYRDWEPRGAVAVAHRPLRATTISASEAARMIDEVPILMVAAAAARGRTVIRGLKELEVKESDRLRVMAQGLSSMGIRISVTSGADVQIEGGQLRGALLDSAGDHRMAMSFAVAGLVAGAGSTRIRGAECVRKSFGDFFELVGRAAGAGCVVKSG